MKMRWLLFIAAFVIIGSFIECASINEDFDRLSKECIKELGLEDMIKSKISYDPDNPKVKCFGACLLKKKGYIIDGKINVEKGIQLMEEEEETLTKETVRNKKDKEIFSSCADKANKEAGECDIAAALFKCMKE